MLAGLGAEGPGRAGRDAGNPLDGGLTLPPYLLSGAIDDNLAPGWVLALLGAGLVNAWLAMLRHRTMTKIRMDANFRTVRALVEVLAVVVLLGVPLLAILLGPLLGRLMKVQNGYRENQGRLATRLVDLIEGLRVLNPFGGKGTYAERYFWGHAFACPGLTRPVS